MDKNNSEPLLFIGGYGDGKVLMVRPRDETIQLEPPYELMATFGGGDCDLVFNLHTYHKHRLTAGDAIYHVMVHDREKRDIMDLLINGYGKRDGAAT